MWIPEEPASTLWDIGLEKKVLFLHLVACLFNIIILIELLSGLKVLENSTTKTLMFLKRYNFV